MDALLATLKAALAALRATPGYAEAEAGGDVTPELDAAYAAAAAAEAAVFAAEQQ